MEFDLDRAIRKVPDFPKPGIIFYDITGILTKPDAFAFCLKTMEDAYRDRGFDAVAVIEARGFLFGTSLAEKLKIPLILVRKKGKLPGETLTKGFELEYGWDEIQIHKADVPPGGTILIIDDLVATGGTLKAAAELLSEAGGRVGEIFCVVGLPFLSYREVLKDYRVRTLIEYDNESNEAKGVKEHLNTPGHL